MSSNVSRNLKALKFLSKASRSVRSSFIDKSEKDLILALCEVIHNVLIGNVKLSKSRLQKLKRYNKVLYRVAKKSTSLKEKKRLLVQRGGFLTTLLPPAIAVLASILSNL